MAAAGGMDRRATENVPPVASARVHSHSTRPSNSACDTGCPRRCDDGRSGCTIRTSAPTAIASPARIGTRVCGASLRPPTRVPFALPRSSIVISPASPTCRRKWRRDAFASSSFTSTPAVSPRPTTTSPRAGSANLANCFESHHQQMQTRTTALTARQRRLVPQRGRGRHTHILARVVDAPNASQRRAF